MGKKSWLENFLKKIYSVSGRHQRVILIALITLMLLLTYFEYMIILIFIALAGLSKMHQRIVRHSLGIDLVFFFTIITSLIYKSTLLGLAVAWISLLIADVLGSRLSHTSLISLISLSSVVLMSAPVSLLPITVASMILLIVYDILSAALYYIMGSSPQRIITFISSHLLFNIFLIMSFARTLELFIGK